MYTVLIVDDEEPVLESYAFILGSGVSGFCLAGKARSGYEAIKLIYELNPDVVFMDINMPGMDGLDTIAEVHEKFPDTVFVLSTAYERFDLARRAIPLGVQAYLVKPVTKKMFTETLGGIEKLLDRRKTAKRQPTAGGMDQRFLKELVWKELSGDEWDGIREELGLDSDRGMVAFIGLDSETGSFFPEINARLSLGHRFLFANHLGLGMYFFPGEVKPDSVLAAIVETVASVVPQTVASFVGIGTVRSGTEFYLSCAEALDDINRKKNSTEVRIRERMRIIALRRKNGLSELAEEAALFRAYRDEVFSSYGFTVAKAKLVSLFTLLLDDIFPCYKTHSEEIPPFDPSEEIPSLTDIPSFVQWSDGAFERLYQRARQKRTGEFPVPLVKALEFIDGNFDRQIQLSDAADAASVSSAYLSRLFGEHTGSSFIDYLTVMRIEKAERIIREKRTSIKEVSFAVGYQDPNYFSKIFRKIVGVSPTMYAERIKDGETV